MKTLRLLTFFGVLLIFPVGAAWSQVAMSAVGVTISGGQTNVTVSSPSQFMIQSGTGPSGNIFGTQIISGPTISQSGGFSPSTGTGVTSSPSLQFTNSNQAIPGTQSIGTFGSGATIVTNPGNPLTTVPAGTNMIAVGRGGGVVVTPGTSGVNSIGIIPGTATPGFTVINAATTNIASTNPASNATLPGSTTPTPSVSTISTTGSTTPTPSVSSFSRSSGTFRGNVTSQAPSSFSVTSPGLSVPGTVSRGAMTQGLSGATASPGFQAGVSSTFGRSAGAGTTGGFMGRR